MSLAAFTEAHTAEVAGWRISYHVSRPAVVRTPPVLALHGFGVTSFRTFRYVVEELAARGVPLVAPDLLGFGQSDVPGGDAPFVHTFERYARLALGLAHEVGLKRPVLLGHSLGGKLAAAATALHPEAWRGVVLANPGGFSVWERFTPFFGGSPVTRWLLAQRWMTESILPRTPFGAVLRDDEALAQLRRFQHSHAALDLGRAGLWNALRRANLPRLLLWGDDDPILPRSTVARIQRRLPGIAVQHIPGAGHAPMKDQPATFAEAVARFAASV